mmetsp:Transcript_15467/g.47888  ORF Transcript_15467/g.47888 Transcript_15467/m.47888 type:complete len:301 (-) Transcript_15467:65-967(-)
MALPPQRQPPNFSQEYSQPAPVAAPQPNQTKEHLSTETLQAVAALVDDCPAREHLFDGPDRDAIAYVADVAHGYRPLPEAVAYWSRASPFLRRAAPPLDRLMDRALFILYLKRRFGYRSYLEIGCRSDACFARAPFADKVGVDPVEGGTVRATSDAFFASCTRTFDLVFVDGLHEAAQVVRDVYNALRFLEPGGCVLLHDCKPLFRDEAEHPMPPGVTFWNGTVWKAVAALRADPTLDVIVGDFDWGLGIVRAAPNTRLLVLHVPFAEIPWEDYERGWRDILRPSTMAEVDRWLGGMARI